MTRKEMKRIVYLLRLISIERKKADRSKHIDEILSILENTFGQIDRR